MVHNVGLPLLHQYCAPDVRRRNILASRFGYNSARILYICATQWGDSYRILVYCILALMYYWPTCPLFWYFGPVRNAACNSHSKIDVSPVDYSVCLRIDAVGTC